MPERIYTRKDSLTENLHGIQVPDPYRWLEGDPDSSELRSWLTKQADRSSRYFKSIPIRNTLRDEFKKIFDRDSISIPTPRQGKYFYEKRKANEDMAVLYVKEGMDGTARVLINPNTLSPDKTTVLSDWDASRDGKFLVYALSQSGNDRNELRVMDVESGKDIDEAVPDSLYPEINTWNLDGTGFWYSCRDPRISESEARLHRRIFFHRLGTPIKEDTLVWGEDFPKDCLFWVRLSSDGRYLAGVAYGREEGKEWTEIYAKDLRQEQDFILVVKRIPGSLFYSGRIHRDRLYVLTNHDAPKWKLMATDIASALGGKPQFADVLPEVEDVLENCVPVGDKLFATYLHDVHTVMREYALDGRLVREIPLPTLGTAGGFSLEEEGDELFYVFSSFVYPPTVYRLDLRTGETEVVEKLRATFDTSKIETKQVWYESKDGTKVPMFVVHRKGIKQDGTNPCLLYGYGGFNVDLSPSYMSTTVPFIERDGVFAIANLRGGGEFGKEWHEAGMRKNKQNVFDDFIAGAEYLISEKYTSSARLAVMGGSNGGLLVAATLVQRPDLVGAAVCRVPVTDMLRYHLLHGDEGVHWIPEYGDPDDPDMFRYLLSYSPYHNVKDGEQYPAILITTSDGDDRVHPFHSYKLAARLEEANTSDKPILMRVETKAGHSGAAAISRSIEEDADVWSFIFDQLGMIESQA